MSLLALVVMTMSSCLRVKLGENGWSIVNKAGRHNDTPTQVHQVNEVTQMQQFDEIDVAGPFNVILEQGQAATVRVEGTVDQLASMTIYVKDGDLVIDMKEDMVDSGKFFKGMRVFVSAPMVRSIEIAGSVSVTAPKVLAVGDTELEVAGSGDITLDGLTCKDLDIETLSNRVDIGVRVELPAQIFAPLTDSLYESKIVYRTEKFEDNVRTFCMNPYGIVVNENTNGIVTVNGHSFEDPSQRTENTNFALLVSKHFTEPFKDSNGYGEGIARLSNMLGGGVIVQRFGDLIRGRRSNHKRIEESFVRPTLQAEPGDLSLVLPKRILDGIIEMIYALDRIAPGTANDDTLLYGVEVKFYNMEVKVDEHLETRHKGLYMIGDGSGVTHSLSHASASGVFVAREILADY